MSKKCYKVITFFLFLGFVFGNLEYAPLALAGPQSTTYEIKSYDFGSGGTANTDSTTYSLFGTSGLVGSSKLDSTTYSNLPGLTYTLTSNVPPAPTFTNPSSYTDRLSLTISTGSNASDTVYAIAISPDAFSSTTQYVQADDTVGASPVWQTNAVWGASGFLVIGLTNGTTYTVKVSAKQGKYTQSDFGPTAAAATSNTSFSFSLDNNSLTFAALDPGTVKTSTTTVTATVSTSGSGGATIYAYDSNAGLLSSRTSYTISSGSNDLSGVAEGYGLRATAVGQSSGGPMQKVSPYNGAGNNVGILDTSKRSIFDSTGAAVTSGTGTFELQAKAGSTAKAATDYADTITVIASSVF